MDASSNRHTTLPDVKYRNIELALSKDESVQQIHENGDEISSSVDQNSLMNGPTSENILDEMSYDYG